MSTSVKLFESTQTGAPSLSGTAGNLISLLDAVLVNGYNLVALDSITRSGSVATASRAAGHGCREHDVVLHAGNTQAEYNGEFRIYDVTSTTYKFDVTGTPTTPGTGSPTSKIAPLGWTKQYSGTNKAVYLSSDPAATAMLLRVDDATAKYAATKGYESMTDVDTGSGMFSMATSCWYKSSTADATLRNWMVVGDAKFFYLLSSWDTSNNYAGYYFGDINSYKSGDAFHCVLNSDLITTAGSMISGSQNYFLYYGVEEGHILARAHSQLSGQVKFAVDANPVASFPVYPNPVDNGLLLSVVHLREQTSNAVRGVMPGMYRPLHTVASMPSHGTVIDNIPAAPGKRFFMAAATDISGQASRVIFDATGPWR